MALGHLRVGHLRADICARTLAPQTFARVDIFELTLPRLMLGHLRGGHLYLSLMSATQVSGRRNLYEN